MKRLAIIGAGISGLTLADQLQDVAEVVIFEKSRGVGGRMASRRQDSWRFDHGAAYFTARSQAFKTFLKPHIDSGLVAQWEPRVLTLGSDRKSYRRDWFEAHYVAVPGMTALCKNLADKLSVKKGHEITALHRTDNGWQLYSHQQNIDEPFDWVIASAPAPQSHALMPDTCEFKTSLQSIALQPCLALMLGLKSPPKWNFDAARCKHPVLSWLWNCSSKPGRPLTPAIVLHSTAQWAADVWQASDEAISENMLEALFSLTDTSTEDISIKSLKRWKLAQAHEPKEPLLFIDSDQSLACCGDWTRKGNVEAAYLSAVDLATAIQARLIQ